MIELDAREISDFGRPRSSGFDGIGGTANTLPPLAEGGYWLADGRDPSSQRVGIAVWTMEHRPGMPQPLSSRTAEPSRRERETWLQPGFGRDRRQVAKESRVIGHNL